MQNLNYLNRHQTKTILQFIRMAKPFEVPEYLTGDLVEYALQQGLQCKNVHVRHVIFSAGSAAGDNYCGEIIRAKVKFSRGGAVKTQLSLIIKCIQSSPVTDILIKSGIFNNEENMFLIVLPKIEKILEQTISPRCYFTCVEPSRTIFMDDLKPFGFILANRTKKLDLEHSTLVMKNLGQLHAGSMVFAEKYPEDANKLSKPTMLPSNKDEVNPIQYSVFGKTFKSFINLIAEMPKFVKISWKLRKFSEDFIVIAGQCYDNSLDKIKVINHGDCWINNMMFKYLDKKLVDFRFVGFPNFPLTFLIISHSFRLISNSVISLVLE